MWRAFTKDGEHLFEGKHGRPVELGNEGKLVAIAEEENHHTVMIDLQRGVIILGYDGFDLDSGQLNIHNPKQFIWICDETNIVGDLTEVIATEPDAEGWFENRHEPLVWRPIWFTRHVVGVTTSKTQVIGAQTTIPAMYSDTGQPKNIKKMVMLYQDGRMGIA